MITWIWMKSLSQPGNWGIHLFTSSLHLISIEDLEPCRLKASMGIQSTMTKASSKAVHRQLILFKPLRTLVSDHPAVSLQTWVDDVSFDIHSRDADFAAREALGAFRTLKTQVEGAGLKLNTDKTGFLTSSKEAARAVKALLQEGDPEHYDVLRDLGGRLYGWSQETSSASQETVPQGQRQGWHSPSPSTSQRNSVSTSQRSSAPGDVVGCSSKWTGPHKDDNSSAS